MVKRIRSFLFVTLLVIICLAPALSMASELPRVVDDAALFTDSQEAQIAEKAQEIVDRYQVDVVVVTSYEAEYDASQAFADDYYDYNGYGVGEDGAGLLYLIDMKNRVPTISTKGVMIDYITDSRLDDLFDCSYDALKEGKYATSTLQLLEQLNEFMSEGRQEGSFRYDAETGVRLTGLYNALTGAETLMAALAGVILMLVIIGSVAARYQLKGNTYRFDRDTQASFSVAEDNETYLRSTVVRTPRNQGGGTGGAGGGGMGSGVHTSSSGSSHGGGSGRGF